MDNAGIYTLCALSLGAAMPQSLLTPILLLDGMESATFDFDFRYGSGTGTAIVIVATSFDGGATWRQIARRDFAIASAIKNACVDAKQKPPSPYADLTTEGINDGLLADRLALFLTTTGNYANTSLAVRASVR